MCRAFKNTLIIRIRILVNCIVLHQLYCVCCMRRKIFNNIVLGIKPKKTLNLSYLNTQIMQSKLILIIVSIAMLTFSSFKNSPEYLKNIGKKESAGVYQGGPKELIGKWVMDGDPNTYIELRSDGTVIEKSLGEPLKRYWLLKDSKLCLKATSVEGGTEKCLEYVLRKDMLVITMNKMKLHYARFKK